MSNKTISAAPFILAYHRPISARYAKSLQQSAHAIYSVAAPAIFYCVRGLFTPHAATFAPAPTPLPAGTPWPQAHRPAQLPPVQRPHAKNPVNRKPPSRFTGLMDAQWISYNRLLHVTFAIPNLSLRGKTKKPTTPCWPSRPAPSSGPCSGSPWYPPRLASAFGLLMGFAGLTGLPIHPEALVRLLSWGRGVVLKTQHLPSIPHYGRMGRAQLGNTAKPRTWGKR